MQRIIQFIFHKLFMSDTPFFFFATTKLCESKRRTILTRYLLSLQQNYNSICSSSFIFMILNSKSLLRIERNCGWFDCRLKTFRLTVCAKQSVYVRA